MLFSKNTQVIIDKPVNTEKLFWCHSALLFHVKNGTGALMCRISNDNDDYWYDKQLLLNGKPILQATLPVCSTCQGLLIAGYGIEKINFPELQQITEAINTEYVDLQTSFHLLKPLLGLLSDGDYLLADIPHIPTDGEGHFFWNPPETDRMSAVCQQYYHHDCLTAIDSFPAFLYPTQSDSCFNPERAEYYQKCIRQKNAPRAIAFYAYGFISALLDGHHKAYAAAKQGIPVSCLTIIPCTGYTDYDPKTKKFISADFAGISVPVKELVMNTSLICGKAKKFSLQSDKWINQKFADTAFQLKSYLTVQEIADRCLLDLMGVKITMEMIENWLLHSNEAENQIALRCALQDMIRDTPEQGLILAEKLLSLEDNEISRSVWDILLDHKEIAGTEQIFLEYIISHDKNSLFWDKVTSYWDDMTA